MNNETLLNMILDDQVRIVEAISTGAAWEVWMQIELISLLRRAGIQTAREVPYPEPCQSLRLDVLARDPQGLYAIELKVESATNAGAAVLIDARQDIVKIMNYSTPGSDSCVRWVVAIGYSLPARNVLKGFADIPANNAIYEYSNNIGILVAAV